jgi:hypothetical protein
MTYQRGPEDRHSTDYIDRTDTSLGWAPLILGVVLAGLFVFLLFGTSWRTGPSDRPTVSQRPELPSVVPGAPSVPTPAPPKPQ